MAEVFGGVFFGLLIGGTAGLLIGGSLGYNNACKQAGAEVVDVGGQERCLSPDKAREVRALRDKIKALQ